MSQAILLAGGKGERLRPLTEDRPKCMISVMGRPLLAYLIQWVSAYGYNRIVLACGYRHDVIQEFFGDGSKYGVQIEYIVETEPLGRGGGLKQAMSRIDIEHRREPVLAMNADAITNLNLSDLRSFHKSQNGLATLVSVPLMSPYGIIDVSEQGDVCGFREKPELPFWINAGIYLMEPTIFDLLPDRGDHEETTFPLLAKDGRLKAYRSRSFWRSVDTVKDLGELRNELERLFFGAFFSPAAAVLP